MARFIFSLHLFSLSARAWPKPLGYRATRVAKRCDVCARSVTESCLEPMKAQLTELDSAIADQLGQIAAVKSTILHHDVRIAKLLGSVTKS